MGNVLTPTQTKEQPEIKWPSHPKRFYTACMIGNMTLLTFNFI